MASRVPAPGGHRMGNAIMGLHYAFQTGAQERWCGRPNRSRGGSQGRRGIHAKKGVHNLPTFAQLSVRRRA